MFYSTYRRGSNGEVIDPALLPAPVQAQKSLYYRSPLLFLAHHPSDSPLQPSRAGTGQRMAPAQRATSAPCTSLSL